MTVPDRSSRAIDALSQIGQIIVAGRDYEQVLDDVITAVGKVMRAEQGGCVLYDEATNELVLQKPAFGVSDEVIAAYRIPLDRGGVAVSVFVTGEPYYTNDPENDDRPLREYIELFGSKSLLTVPLGIEGRRIGVFHLLNNTHRGFDDEDVRLMSLLAPQISMIVHSAEMFRRLQARERQLERMIEAHRSLTASMLSGRDLRALTSDLAMLIGRPVVIVDAAGDLLGEHAPDESDRRALSRQAARVEQHGGDAILSLGVRTGSIAFRLEGERHVSDTVLVPIAAGSENLGYIATRDEPRLDDVELRALEQFSMLFAMEIVRARELHELEQRLQTDILERLWMAKDGPEAERLLARLGFDHPPPYRVVHLRAHSAHDDLGLSESFAIFQRRVVSALRARLAESYPAAAVVARGHGFPAIVPASGDPDADRRRLERVLRALSAVTDGAARHELYIGIGPSVDAATELRASHDEAVRVTALAAQLGLPGRPLLPEDLGVYGLIVRPVTGTQQLDAYVQRVLGPLLRYQGSGGMDWLGFLEDLVASNFSVTAAAARAHVHLNTAKYRIRRIEELLDRSLADPDERFAVQMALKIRAAGAALADGPAR